MELLEVSSRGGILARRYDFFGKAEPFGQTGFDSGFDGLAEIRDRFLVRAGSIQLFGSDLQEFITGSGTWAGLFWIGGSKCLLI